MDIPLEDHRAADFPEFALPLFEDLKKIFRTEQGQVFVFPSSGTGGWEADLTGTRSTEAGTEDHYREHAVKQGDSKEGGCSDGGGEWSGGRGDQATTRDAEECAAAVRDRDNGTGSAD